MEYFYTKSKLDIEEISKNYKPIISIKELTQKDIEIIKLSKIKTIKELKKENKFEIFMESKDKDKYLSYVDQSGTLRFCTLFISIFNNHAALWVVVSPSVFELETSLGWQDILFKDTRCLKIHLAFRDSNQDSYSIYYEDFTIEDKLRKVFIVGKFEEINIGDIKIIAAHAKPHSYIELESDCLEFSKELAFTYLSMQKDTLTRYEMKALNDLTITNWKLEKYSRLNKSGTALGISILGNNYVFNLMVCFIVSIIVYKFMKYFEF